MDTRRIVVEPKRLAMDMGLFLAIVVVLFAILVPMVFLSRGVWDKRLQARVLQSIDRAYPGEYVAGGKVDLKGPYATSAAAYELIPVSTMTRGPCYGVIIRIATLYGPLPAVYICTPAAGVEFIGFAVFDPHIGKEASITESLRHSMQVLRWKSRIPKIIGLSKEFGGENDGQE